MDYDAVRQLERLTDAVTAPRRWEAALAAVYAALERGATDEQRMTALNAILNYLPRAVGERTRRFLLESADNIAGSFMGGSINDLQDDGETLLMHACADPDGDPEFVAILARAGQQRGRRVTDLDLTSEDEGYTALMIASSWSPDIVRVLMEAGANPFVRNGFNKSAVSIAAESNLQCLQVLLEHGADPFPRFGFGDSGGLTLLDFVARERPENREPVEELLREYAAPQTRWDARRVFIHMAGHPLSPPHAGVAGSAAQRRRTGK